MFRQNRSWQLSWRVFRELSPPDVLSLAGLWGLWSVLQIRPLFLELYV